MQEISIRVLQYLQYIPLGKVTTYKNIADKFGIHPRRVAMIMKFNKSPDMYPCYKVVAHDGKVSGYSANGGVSEKIKKLLADGVIVVNGKVDEKYII